MKKPIRGLLYVVLLVAVVFVIRRTWFADTPVSVRVTEVGRGVVESTISNSKAGTVRARRRASLSPEVGGYVLELPHARGDRVPAGEVLVRLADAAEKARFVLAEKALALALAENDHACIAAERARRELERNRDLAAQNFLSADALDSLESTYTLAVATCTAHAAESERARATVLVAKAELDKTVLRAPFEGVIAEQNAELGEWITPSPPMLRVPGVIDLIDTKSLYVSAPMDEVDSARLAVGNTAKITLDPYPGSVYAGRVVRVAPYVLDVEAQNRTLEIEVEFDDVTFASKLLPGTSADVEIVLKRFEDTLRIPTSALIGGSKVLVLRSGRLEERAIEVEMRNWDFVAVRSGLAAGEYVVVTLDSPRIKADAKAIEAAGASRP